VPWLAEADRRRWIVLELSGRANDALAFSDEMVRVIAGRRPDRRASLVARTCLMDSYFWCGRLHEARAENQRALDLYVDDEDRDMVFTYSFDMKVANLLYASGIMKFTDSTCCPSPIWSKLSPSRS
jgi:hypothetical protein